MLRLKMKRCDNCKKVFSDQDIETFGYRYKDDKETVYTYGIRDDQDVKFLCHDCGYAKCDSCGKKQPIYAFEYCKCGKPVCKDKTDGFLDIFCSGSNHMCN